MKNFKKVISAVVALALSATTFVSAASFTDVAKTASYAEAIDVLSSLGIVNGYEDGTFKPEGEITRAEAATMIVGALNMTADAVNAAGTTQFADVNEKAAWASGYINVGVAQKFISGMGDGTFAPQANVTYAQMCVMLTSIAGYGDYAASQGGYPTGYTNMAATTGINKGVAVADNTALTRGQVAQMIYNTLTTPMLGVSEYSLTGNTYAQLNGKGQNPVFKTLLSDKFDGYTALVSIEATPVSDNSLENDEVKISVQKADWWLENVEAPIPNSAGKAFNNRTIKVAAGVDVNSNLLQVGKAVFTYNEDDELVLVFFAATNKIETVELEAADYVKQDELADNNQFSTTNAKIRFASKYYTMAGSVAVYVNGNFVTNIDNEADSTATPKVLTTAQAALDNYIGRALGTVKLVDNNDTIKGYDAIMVDIWNIAKVAGVDYDNDRTTLTISTTFAADTAYDTIVIDDEAVEEGETVVAVEKNGEEADLVSLAKDDIIAYKTGEITGTSTTLENPKELLVVATNETATGKFSSTDADDETYTVDGTVYTAVNYRAGLMQLAETYTLTLDPFGRIYSVEKDGSAEMLAIALDVTSDDYLKMVLADGTVKSYPIESGASVIKNVPAAGGASANTIGALDAYIKNKAPEQRVVKYKVRNSTGELSSIDLATVNGDNALVNAETYKARTGRLGSSEITAETAVIDATKATVDVNAAAGYAAFNVDTFKDGAEYKYVSFKSGTYTTLVIITAIGTKLGSDSRFAVVRKTATRVETEDGDEVDSVVVLLDGEAEKELLFEVGVANNLKVGDAFYYDVNAYGYVSDVFTIYNGTTFTTLAAALTAAGKTPSDYIQTDADEDDGWRYDLANTDRADIQLVEGYVIPGADGVVTFAEAGALTKIDTTKDHKVAGDKGVAIYSVASDVQAYVYDKNNANIVKAYDKFSVKADASVLASTRLEKYEDEGIYGVGPAYTTDMSADANYAIAMIIDDVVVEIYVIK